MCMLFWMNERLNSCSCFLVNVPLEVLLWNTLSTFVFYCSALWPSWLWPEFFWITVWYLVQVFKCSEVASCRMIPTSFVCFFTSSYNRKWAWQKMIRETAAWWRFRRPRQSTTRHWRTLRRWVGESSESLSWRERKWKPGTGSRSC